MALNWKAVRKNYKNIEKYENYLEAIRPLYLKIVDNSIVNSGVQKKDLLTEIEKAEKFLTNMSKSYPKNKSNETIFDKRFIQYEKLISDYANYQRELKKSDFDKISDLKKILSKRDKLYEYKDKDENN